jgi:hypothetical protein
MLIDKEALKNVIENETRVWLKNIIEMSIKFCGGFDSFIIGLQNTARKRETKIIYGSSDEWRIVFYPHLDEYKLVQLTKN